MPHRRSRGHRQGRSVRVRVRVRVRALAQHLGQNRRYQFLILEVTLAAIVAL